MILEFRLFYFHPTLIFPHAKPWLIAPASPPLFHPHTFLHSSSHLLVLVRMVRYSLKVSLTTTLFWGALEGSRERVLCASGGVLENRLLRYVKRIIHSWNATDILEESRVDAWIGRCNSGGQVKGKQRASENSARKEGMAISDNGECNKTRRGDETKGDDEKLSGRSRARDVDQTGYYATLAGKKAEGRETREI
ncbi:hypothetical protein EXIGLDRAFT_527984 [Exidia glandulosa HHB12029]|uniref:Uncharacterized protein n=1 Tax=Exidia glandulosa HHB12029 TaxID=1314781 RepID=A0A165IYK7_EXIGL|nr:hypothetical protein EXIGLDRAFT_527984 [Exidia glandulosa HHB12029]